MIITIVNVKRTSEPYLYIGRPPANRHLSGGHYGNPFSHMANTLAAVRVATRDEAVDAFRDWLNGVAHQDIEPVRRLWILAALLEIAEIGEDVALGCFCAPLRCHGDILKERILEIREKLEAVHD